MPAGIASAHAALAEPLSCAVSAQAHHLRVSQEEPHKPRTASNGLADGGVTVIIGAGAMGRMHVDIALAAKPRAIIIADVMPERLQLCERLFAERAAGQGVKLYTSPAGDALRKTIFGVSERGADDVIVAVGVKQAIHEAQFLVARGGVLNLFGGLPKRDAEVAFDTTAVHYNEIVITGSSGGSPWDVAESLSLMAKRAIDPSLHITRIGDLAHVPVLLEQMKNQQLDGKAMIYPHRPNQTIRQVNQWTHDDERDYLAGVTHE
jgi:L-iditol 2-dehydrogenase